ncbi:UDP-N-acetyl-D-galactosamine dehydrogenase [Pustulibacterium marinum]|uniref:UDP-N-acetyl-D-galactosamine dehydrogenase n=1 Tax=Pustulibacterium marinum TaxID=1224947 RepID=A0A1I7ETJ4_9FLAO|nr:nucleotide sugar dehydrogenase [Pustulibacterium marinum]SFU27274.1 UDP-N-acetyl-D-galactosamine dehydrogenase [Pustulibacterium marinum]
MKTIAIIGLGYVGLPLSVEFSKNNYQVIGFDIHQKRIADLQNFHDATLEVSEAELQEAKTLQYTSNPEDLKQASVYIVTVPTPIDQYKKPDLTPIISASKEVAKWISKGDIIIYESTVFPGCTEEVCVPILEEISGLKFNTDFYCGYSPERINPGDKERRVHNIVKVTSGSTLEIAEEIDQLYKSIVKVGTHKASSIKVAEAAKVIENSQRDLNIAFVNELSMIFDKMNINTLEVLEAAGTKWNFLPFRPGLVGGHCIGVDPYYLTYKAQSLGHNPEVILAGRRINDNMGAQVVKKYIKHLLSSKKDATSFKTLILGFTFKENCPDIRNTRVIDIYSELLDFGIQADIYDPIASNEEITHEYGIEVHSEAIENYDGIIVAVGHEEFLGYDWETIAKDTIIFDVKSILKKGLATDSL